MDADIIVIGAGAAGLAAARSLGERSLRTVVLEARDRVGGRAWSRSSGRAQVAVELGAEFVHGQAHETAALLREIGSAAIETADESWTYTADGTLQRTHRDFFSTIDLFRRALTLDPDESVDQFLRRFATDGVMHDSLMSARAIVEGFDAADATIASARAIADEWESGVNSLSARPLGGYRPMLEHVERACSVAGVRICLSTVVHRITWRRGEVTVHVTNDLGESHAIRARAAIVTLPIGVLRHHGDDTAIVFDPDLPRSKSDAIGIIEMGHVVKIVLRFQSAFWERIDGARLRDAAFFRCPDRPFPAFWTQFPVRAEQVVAWVGGPKAIALNHSPHPELIRLALDEFGMLLGNRSLARDEFEGAAMHDWSRDPFARGAYSYVLVGGANARASLAEPLDGTLFFAGEATACDGQSGTVNGALATGERAAREAVLSLSGAMR